MTPGPWPPKLLATMVTGGEFKVRPYGSAVPERGMHGPGGAAGGCGSAGGDGGDSGRCGNEGGSGGKESGSHPADMSAQ